MNREDIIKLAREAGLILLLDEDCFQAMGVKNFERTKRVIERFATLIAAAEREACAKVCEEVDALNKGFPLNAKTYAAAIRARGQA